MDETVVAHWVLGVPEPAQGSKARTDGLGHKGFSAGPEALCAAGSTSYSVQICGRIWKVPDHLLGHILSSKASSVPETLETFSNIVAACLPV